MPKQKPSPIPLRALFIGIDAYDERIVLDDRAIFPALSGCVRDAEVIKKHLAEDADFKLDAVTLYNEAATRENIIRGIREHLGKANAGESVLLYYSGHGAREEADTSIWRSESDGKLEGIVCYYEQKPGESLDKQASKVLLVNKELRYLLHELTEKTHAHVTAVFDCCHSGDNTRAATDSGVTRKQAEIVFKPRPWKDFLFATAIPEETARKRALEDLLPEGRYVSITAAERNESALETTFGTERHGVLTWFLLEALRQSRGQVSNRDLMSRVRNRIRYDYAQQPRAYAPRNAAELLSGGFLQKPAGYASDRATLQYNADKTEYRIDRGALHRVAPGRTTVEVKDAEGKTQEGRITSAGLEYAVVEFEQDALVALPRDKALSAELVGLISRPLRLKMVNKDMPRRAFTALTQRIGAGENTAFVTLEDEESEADYLLYGWQGMYYFTRPNDPFRPVVLPVVLEGKTPEAAIAAVEAQLRQMAQWHFILDLQNTDPQTTIAAGRLKVEFLDGNDKPLPADAKGALRIGLSPRKEAGKTTWTGGVKVRLTNTTSDNLYVAALYLSDYGCNATDLLGTTTATLLEEKESHYLLNGQASQLIELEQDATMRLFNLDAGYNALKFIFATETFDAGALEMEALPKSELLAEADLGQGEKRSMKIGKSQAPAPSGWATQLFEVLVENPTYNHVDQALLQSVLDPEKGNPYLAHFFTGLFFEKKGGYKAGYALKKEMKPMEELEGLRGSILFNIELSLGNFWGRWRRNARYERMAKELPGRPHFLAEGDSWFQHPLLTDVIDNIGQVYPVRCLSAAGDTIQHYFKVGEVREEAEKMQPALLLLSGGGNDILGDDMPNLLLEFAGQELAEGEKPERFFSPAFEAKIDSIMALYADLFQHFKEKNPNMPIVVHGYDFPRPVEPDSKAHNWLGDYFDGKGIRRLQDRSAAVHYMIRTFNERLKALAGQHSGQVYYIDVRDTVPDGQWDDEIHPNDSGFGLVAAKFLRQINTLFPVKE